MLSRIDRSRGRSSVAVFFAAGILGLSSSSYGAPAEKTYPKLDPSQAILNAVPYRALPLPLSDVRLTGGPLKHAQELDAKYLLELEPDRMLFHLRERAG